MPTVADFKKVEKKAKPAVKEAVAAETENSAPAEATSKPRNKRRPGRDDVMEDNKPSSSVTDDDIKIVEVEEKMEANQGSNSSEQSQSSQSESKKVEISFPGSEILRAKLPRAFEAAETVASDWVNDTDFSDVPVKHPAVKAAVQQSLRKAKSIEKKVLADPRTEKVAAQAITYALKAQGLLMNLKSKINRK